MKYSACNPYDIEKMTFPLKERIGKPGFFVGRKKELNALLNWVDMIPQEAGKSIALLSRRKKGKSSIVERLYNVIFSARGPVIPFFYQIRELKQWQADFAEDFYRSFLNQYIMFKLNDISLNKQPLTIPKLLQAARDNHFPEVGENIEIFLELLEDRKNNRNALWIHAYTAPHTMASRTGDFILQIIDEFQLINEMIYQDEQYPIQIDTMAGSYLEHAESKVAPMLVTGSWVGWLRNILDQQLPMRFKKRHIENLTPEDAISASLNYAERLDIPITEETATLIAGLGNNDAYYISALVLSDYEKKDLTTTRGVYDTFYHEVHGVQGDINLTWLEYMRTTLRKVNGQYARKIVLYLSNHPEKELNCKMIKRILEIPWDEDELEDKLEALMRGDLLDYGQSRFFYRGIQDDVFNLVLRGNYERSMTEVDEEVTAIAKKLNEDTEAKLQRIIDQLRGRLNYHRGKAMEYYFTYYLKHQVHKDPQAFKDKVKGKVTVTLGKYLRVREYVFNVPDGKQYQVDIYAQAETGPDLAFEVKNRVENNRPGLTQAKEFVEKLEALKILGKDVRGIFYSANGFTKPAEDYLCEHDVLYTDYKQWWGEEFRPENIELFRS